MLQSHTSDDGTRNKEKPSGAPPSVRTREFLLWVNHTARFAATPRLIWVPHLPERERVGAHSYQLCMVAWYIIARYLPHLDLLYHA